MIEISTNTTEFKAQVALAMAELRAQAAVKVDKFARTVFSNIVTTSPQWSQNLASNWNFSVGQPDASYTEHPNKHLRSGKGYTVFSRGDEPVVSQTIARMQARPQVLWGQTVYVSNATPDDLGGDLAQNIEDGHIRLRPQNLLGKQVALFQYTAAKHQADKL